MPKPPEDKHTTPTASLIADTRYRLRTGHNPGGRQVYSADDEDRMRRLADALEASEKENALWRSAVTAEAQSLARASVDTASAVGGLYRDLGHTMAKLGYGGLRNRLSATEKRAEEAEREYERSESARRSALRGTQKVIEERDAAREEVGYEKRLREFVSGERDRFIDLKREAESERDALAAVITRAEDYVTRRYLDTQMGRDVLTELSVPLGDALREVKADVWDEGWSAAGAWQIAEAGTPYPWNPYRQKREEQS